MVRAVLILMGVLVLGACGGSDTDATETSSASNAAPSGQAIVIRARMVVADKERSEPIATGEVLEGSTLGGSAFCAGGTIRDTHADAAGEMYGLVARTITCADGTVTFGFTPDVQIETVSWTIVGGTDALEGLSGTGKMKVVYDPDDDSLARETWTGTVTR